jgi:hypothetical protein
MWLTSWNWLQVSRLRFSHHSSELYNEICHSCFVLLSFQFTIVSGFKSDIQTFQFSLFSSVPLGIAVFFTIYNLQCSCQFMISVPRKWQSIIKLTGINMVTFFFHDRKEWSQYSLVWVRKLLFIFVFVWVFFNCQWHCSKSSSCNYNCSPVPNIFVPLLKAVKLQDCERGCVYS